MDHRRLLCAVLLAGTLFVAACGQQTGEGNVRRADVNVVLKAYAPELMAIEGVTAVAVGKLDSGEDCVRIYVVKLTDELRAQLPATLEGWPVDVEESGEIRPLGD